MPSVWTSGKHLLCDNHAQTAIFCWVLHVRVHDTDWPQSKQRLVLIPFKNDRYTIKIHVLDIVSVFLLLRYLT